MTGSDNQSSIYWSFQPSLEAHEYRDCPFSLRNPPKSTHRNEVQFHLRHRQIPCAEMGRSLWNRNVERGPEVVRIHCVNRIEPFRRRKAIALVYNQTGRRGWRKTETWFLVGRSHSVQLATDAGEAQETMQAAQTPLSAPLNPAICPDWQRPHPR